MRFFTEMAFVAALALLVGMGCASLSLPKDATPEQKMAAMCQDSIATKAMADAALSKTIKDVELRRWYEAARVSAQIGVESYCAPVAPK